MGISASLGSSALLPAGLGFRNVLINGGFDVWQRGTTGFGTTDGTYTADRWRHTSNGLTITRDTDVPVGFRYSAKLVGTSDNSFAQRIEAATSSKLAEKEVYFSCWVKRTSGAGALDVRFYYPSAEDNFATVTQIGSTIVLSSSPSSSWTYYTATITLPSNVSTGLMMLINNVGAATTFITGVQLEQNYQPTPFEQRPIGVELGLCQRYYWRNEIYGAGATGGSGTVPIVTVAFKTKMRASPTITYISGGTTMNGLADLTIGSAYSGLPVRDLSADGAELLFSLASGSQTNGGPVTVKGAIMQASAEL
jgi:hypothetical protein